MIDEKDAPKFFEAGITGLKRYSGLINEEWENKLWGKNWSKIAREMADSELTISGTLYVIEMMLRQTTWRIEPADGSREAERIAEHVESCLDDLLDDGGWQGVYSQMMSMLVYGWASLEKVYKVRRGISAPLGSMRSKHDDGMIGWRKFSIRAQETVHKWNFDQHGGVLGFWQLAPPDYKYRYLPRSKYLHFILRQRAGSPEGYSMLRPLYQSYYFLKNIRVIEAIGIERNLAGLPVMQVPQQVYSTPALLNSYKEMVRKIKVDEYEGIVLPSEENADGQTGYKFSLLSSAGKSPTDVDSIIRRYEQRIAMAMMTQFMLLGQDKVGSYSLADRNTDLFALSLAAILDMRDEQFNVDAIPELVELNGWDARLSPRLVHGDIEAANLAELSGAIASLVSAGALTPDRKLEEHIREIGKLPELGDELTQSEMTMPAAPDAQALSAYGPEIAAQPAADAAALDAAAPVTPDVAAPVTEDTNVQQLALNGAQVSSLLEIVGQFVAGQLPRASAIEIITSAFPIDRAKAELILGSIGQGFTPTPDAGSLPPTPAVGGGA